MRNYLTLDDLFGEKSLEQKMKELAGRLKVYRKKKHITQLELSDISSVPYGTIKLFERTGKISLESLWMLCMALECDDQLETLFTAPMLTADDVRNGR